MVEHSVKQMESFHLFLDHISMQKLHARSLYALCDPLKHTD